MVKRILPIAAVLCAVSVIVMVIALTAGEKSDSFSPPPFETNAQSGTPNVPEDAGYGQIDAKEFLFSAAGELTVNDGSVDVWLTNPKENTVWLKVRILDESGNNLGESGLIKPDEYVRSVKLNTVPKSTENVSLKIMAYEPETYYSAGSAALNTVLTVQGTDSPLKEEAK